MKTELVRVHFGASRWWAIPTLVKRILAKLCRQLGPNGVFGQHQLCPNQAIWASTKWGPIFFQVGERKGGQGRGGQGRGLSGSSRWGSPVNCPSKSTKDGGLTTCATPIAHLSEGSTREEAEAREHPRQAPFPHERGRKSHVGWILSGFGESQLTHRVCGFAAPSAVRFDRHDDESRHLPRAHLRVMSMASLSTSAAREVLSEHFNAPLICGSDAHIHNALYRTRAPLSRHTRVSIRPMEVARFLSLPPLPTVLPPLLAPRCPPSGLLLSRSSGHDGLHQKSRRASGICHAASRWEGLV